jgi:hypothetical protein
VNPTSNPHKEEAADGDVAALCEGAEAITPRLIENNRLQGIQQVIRMLLPDKDEAEAEEEVEILLTGDNPPLQQIPLQQISHLNRMDPSELQHLLSSRRRYFNDQRELLMPTL